MGQGAEFPIFIFFQEPDEGCDEINGRFNKEITLFFDPLSVQS
jgi:hypothetical protein